MKFYIWKRKNLAVNAFNFYPLSKSRIVGENGFVGLAVHAFFKRKEAIKYIEETYDDKVTRNLFELIAVEV